MSKKDLSSICIALLVKRVSMRREKREEEDVHTHEAASPEPSCVSMKSNTSMDNRLQFSHEAVTSDPE